MIVLQLARLLTLVFLDVLKLVTVGLPFRKYSHNPLATVVLSALRRFHQVCPLWLAYYVIYCLVSTMCRLFKWKYTDACSTFEGFGQPYDRRLVWFSKAKLPAPVIIYLHGGGYVMQLVPPQLQGLAAVAQLVSKPVSILILDYLLILGGQPWPRQREELEDTYRRLVNDGYRDIILMGDSAGGHLAVTFLTYLQRLNSDLPWPRLTILISPWVKLFAHAVEKAKGLAYLDNSSRDAIPMDMLLSTELQTMFLGPANNLSSLSVSPGNCEYNYHDWKDIPAFGRGHLIFVMAGEDELMRDDVLEWCYHALGVPLYRQFYYGDSCGRFEREKHQYVGRCKQGGYVEVYVEPWGVHDSLFAIESGVFFKHHAAGLTRGHVDPVRYFALSRLVQFLDNIL